VTLRQVIDINNPREILEFKIIGFSVFLFLSLIGFSILRMLIGRWILTIIYLRKLSRIRRWFVKNDIELKNYIVYGIDDNEPSFVSHTFLSSGLVSLMMILNGSSIGCSLVFALLAFFPQVEFLVILLAGLIVVLAILVLQRIYVLRGLRDKQRESNPAFPTIQEK
ncbi:hypothetical protein SE17_09620, partial [Kouleothrix aurantiaca]